MKRIWIVVFILVILIAAIVGAVLLRLGNGTMVPTSKPMDAKYESNEIEPNSTDDDGVVENNIQEQNKEKQQISDNEAEQTNVDTSDSVTADSVSPVLEDEDEETYVPSEDDSDLIEEYVVELEEDEGFVIG